MRIVLDLQACQASSTHRGIGRYSMALAQAMARRAGGHELIIALNEHFPDAVATIRGAFSGLLPAAAIQTYALPSPIGEYERTNLWRCRAAEQLREHYLASLAPDVVHVASLFEGLSENAASSVLHGDGGFDTAVTLYDLIPLLRKDVYLAEPHVAGWYYRKLQSLKNAELLLAISGHSRQEALDALQLPAEQVVNISSAVDDIFQPDRLAPEQRRAALAPLGLSRPFIMYTGGIDYRKNIEGLIEAFAMLPGALRRQYQLAVVCGIQDADRTRLRRLAARLRLAEDELVLTGYVSDADLVTLYNSTALFVFPSLHEGFGLPALEAMACGAPVIGSNCSSIPEVIGRADALFDPTRTADISAAMHKVLSDPKLEASLRAHGLAQATNFSWDASAARTLSAFEALHERRRARAPLVAAPTRGRRPRLAYVSPLPPERSGIADYSAELLPELARYYDIDVVLEQEDMSDDWIAANFPRRTAAWFEANAEQFERVVYHFGNSSFHQHMFGLLERHPGVVVLHDFFLSGVINYHEPARPHPNAYCRSLYEAHGYHALNEERDHGRERSLYQYPINLAVLEQASGVIVHSSHSADLARHWYGPDSAADWRVIPLLRVLPGPLDREAARRELGIAPDDFLLCTFGLMGMTKCNDKLLEAWLGCALGGDRQCHLVFVGENNILQFGRDLVARIGSHPRIKITGFASRELYRAYLTAADAAVQLRTHSRGETSAGVLDCLAYRLPTIINAHGSAAEIGESAVVKLPDAFTIAELGAAMLALRHDRGAAVELGERAGAYMRALHHPAQVGAQYHTAIEHYARHGQGARDQALLRALGGIDAEAGEADLLQAAACIAANRRPGGARQLLIDVDGLAGEAPAAQLGRALLRHLLRRPPAGWRSEPVRPHEGRLHYARRYTLELIGRPELHLEDDMIEARAGDSLLGFARDGAAPAPAPATLTCRAVGHNALAIGAQIPAALASRPDLAALDGALWLSRADNGAAPDWLPAPALERGAARAALGLGPDDFQICVCGPVKAAAAQTVAQACGARAQLGWLEQATAPAALLAGADLLLQAGSPDDMAWSQLLAALGAAVPCLLLPDAAP